VPQLASHQTDLETVVKGPPANRAFDETGKPTRQRAGLPVAGVSMSLPCKS